MPDVEQFKEFLDVSFEDLKHVAAELEEKATAAERNVAVPLAE